MSDQERLAQREILNQALKDSFRRMLDLKKRLGQPVVTSDPYGNPVVITADEAERLVQND